MKGSENNYNLAFVTCRVQLKNLRPLGHYLLFPKLYMEILLGHLHLLCVHVEDQ